MNETVHVLLVEDNEIDREAVHRVFRRQQLDHAIVDAKDGVEALRLMRGGHVPRPSLILLDLNLPRLSGIEMLRHVRSDPALQSHVVLVLTTSRSPKDVADAYAQNVAGYMVKADLGPGLHLLGEFLDKYTRAVELP